jgi:hypothetical protein
MQNHKLRVVTGSGLYPRDPHEPCGDPDPESLSVLSGKATIKMALEHQSRCLSAATRQNCLRPGEKLDPVLRYHLRRDE